MEKEEEKKSEGQESVDENEETEAIELVLFQVSECYVYIVSKICLFWVFGVILLMGFFKSVTFLLCLTFLVFWL